MENRRENAAREQLQATTPVGREGRWYREMFWYTTVYNGKYPWNQDG